MVNLTSTTTTGPTLLAPSDQPFTSDFASFLSVPSTAAQSPSGDPEEFLRLLHSNTSLHQAAQAAYNHWAPVKDQIKAKKVKFSDDDAALVMFKNGLEDIGRTR